MDLIQINYKKKKLRARMGNLNADWVFVFSSWVFFSFFFFNIGSTPSLKHNAGPELTTLSSDQESDT